MGKCRISHTAIMKNDIISQSGIFCQRVDRMNACKFLGSAAFPDGLSPDADSHHRGGQLDVFLGERTAAIVAAMAGFDAEVQGMPAGSQGKSDPRSAEEIRDLAQVVDFIPQSGPVGHAPEEFVVGAGVSAPFVSQAGLVGTIEKAVLLPARSVKVQGEGLAP